MDQEMNRRVFRYNNSSHLVCIRHSDDKELWDCSNNPFRSRLYSLPFTLSYHILSCISNTSVPGSLCADDNLWRLLADFLHCHLRLFCVILPSHPSQKKSPKLSRYAINCYFHLSFLLGLCLLLLGLLSLVHLTKVNARDHDSDATPSRLPFYLLLSAGTIACLMGISYLINMNVAYKITNDINAKVFKVEGMSLGIIAFSAFLMVVSSTALSTIDQVGDSLEASAFALKALRVLGIIGIVLGFVHLIVVYFEQRTLIKAAVGIMFLLAAVMVVMSGMVLYRTIRGARGGNCDEEMLASLHKDYVAELGCPNKYNKTSTSIKDLTCPKEDIKFVWEENFAQAVSLDDVDEYGCINHGCCSLVQTNLNIVFYAAACGGLVAALALVLTATKAYNFQELEMKVERDHLNADVLLKEGHLPLLLVAVVVLVLVLVLMPKFRLSNAPEVEDYMKVDELPKGVDDVDDLGKFEDYVSSDYIKKSFPLTNYTLVDKPTECEPDCNDFIYHVEVHGPQGSEVSLLPKAYSNKKVLFDREAINDSEGNLIKFKARFEEVNPILKMLRYRPSELTKANKITIDIKARYESDFDIELKDQRDDRRRRLDNDFYTGENPFYPIIKRDITFEFFKDSVITNYKGTVHSRAEGKTGHEPLSEVIIESRSPQFENRIISEEKTDDRGNFELKLPILFNREDKELLPYLITLELKKPGYLPLRTQASVGAHGLITEYELGSFFMIPERVSSDPVNVTGVVFDTEDGELIKGAEVEIADVETETDEEGRFNYGLVNYCGKKIEAEKDGYYPYKKPLFCEDGVSEVKAAVPLTPTISAVSYTHLTLPTNREV
eukprot:TRINITY_DN4104_c0_g1_i19.p1 TRINITY_DN4104_c0_g1~~TRINITY_DN4104_c0_g1_i19.p1  ORF type:complete len:835 (-),score=230.43 TRINITY_DN4104_c0_g1_i19:18-2522(-)